MPGAAARRSSPARRPASVAPPPRDVHDRRAGARVRPDDARDPLLRRLRPDRAGALGPPARLHLARPRPAHAHAARQAPRAEARGGEGARRHVRDPARQPRASCAASSTCSRASAPTSRRASPSCGRRSTRCSRTRPSARAHAEGAHAMSAPAPAFPAALDDARAFAIARAMLDGFDRHYRLFRQASSRGEGSASSAPTGTASSTPRRCASSTTTPASPRPSSGCRPSSPRRRCRRRCGSRSSCTTSAS